MRCGLLGEHLAHSYSPQIHALLGDYSYELFEVAPERLGEFLRSGCFDGLNVTIPYKKAVIPYCSGLSEAAKALGSVNTILRRPDGSLYGDNTDVDGFRWMLSLGGGVDPAKRRWCLEAAARHRRCRLSCARRALRSRYFPGRGRIAIPRCRSIRTRASSSTRRP